MARNVKYKPEQIIQAIHETKGMVSLAAQALGCSPQTIYIYMDKHPDIRQAIQEEREKMTDIAELALYSAIQDKEAWAVCFYLKTQGKERGYVERQQVEHSGTIGIKELQTMSDEELEQLAKERGLL